VSADVVGYSRLMANDEQATLTALKRHRREVIDPAIAENNGRIVKLMGDGILIEFASVVDAVHASVTIQRAMGRHNNQAAAGQGTAFRFGINVGEIVLDDGDIYGDGVNVVARLQEIADPGGIAISDRFTPMFTASWISASRAPAPKV
jgi:class 3 adenylate cyclase